MEFNTQKFKSLAEQNNWPEAKKLLEDFLRESFINQQEGEAMLAVTSAYLEASNSLSRQQLEVLDNTLDMLKDLDKQQKRDEDAIDLSLARHQISKG
jgi:hypothetical protein